MEARKDLRSQMPYHLLGYENHWLMPWLALSAFDALFQKAVIVGGRRVSSERERPKKADKPQQAVSTSVVALILNFPSYSHASSLHPNKIVLQNKIKPGVRMHSPPLRLRLSKITVLEASF